MTILREDGIYPHICSVRKMKRIMIERTLHKKRKDYGDCCNNNPQRARNKLSHRLWLRSLAGRQCHQGVGRHLQVLSPIMIFESFILMITSQVLAYMLIKHDMKIMTLRLIILLRHLRFTMRHHIMHRNDCHGDVANHKNHFSSSFLHRLHTQQKVIFIRYYFNNFWNQDNLTPLKIIISI